MIVFPPFPALPIPVLESAPDQQIETAEVQLQEAIQRFSQDPQIIKIIESRQSEGVKAVMGEFKRLAKAHTGQSWAPAMAAPEKLVRFFGDFGRAQRARNFFQELARTQQPKPLSEWDVAEVEKCTKERIGAHVRLVRDAVQDATTPVLFEDRPELSTHLRFRIIQVLGEIAWRDLGGDESTNIVRQQLYRREGRFIGGNDEHWMRIESDLAQGAEQAATIPRMKPIVPDMLNTIADAAERSGLFDAIRERFGDVG